MTMPTCKITVLKRSVYPDLIDEYMEGEDHENGPCECFQDGEEFIIDPEGIPEDFLSRCPFAWADIYRDILSVASGADMPGIKPRGTMITGCRDWFRPVIF